MSIFDKKFKLENVGYKDKTIAVVASSIHNKLSISEISRLYDLISSDAMTLESDYEKITAGMKILDTEKSSWLTNDEKRNFVTGVWIAETRYKSAQTQDLSYINQSELDYTRKAILGTIFKNI